VDRFEDVLREQRFSRQLPEIVHGAEH
jgi:hypothetical protein